MTVTKQKSLWGKKAFVSPEDYLVGRGAIAAGGDDKPTIVLPGAPDVVALFDDFLGDVVADQWNAVEGDTGHSQAIQPLTNGIYRLSNSATATATQAGGQALTSELNWKANQGPGNQSGKLRMAARIKAGTYTMGGLFVGFTDNKAFETPAYDTGGGLITPAADCVGFMFGENASIGDGWNGVSARSTAGDSGDQSTSLDTGAPDNNVYQTLEVEVHRGLGDTGGTATFWIDGIPKGTISSPVATGVALTPYVGVFDVNDTGAPVVDIDFINVSAPRDTGE